MAGGSHAAYLEGLPGQQDEIFGYNGSPLTLLITTRLVWFILVHFNPKILIFTGSAPLLLPQYFYFKSCLFFHFSLQGKYFLGISATVAVPSEDVKTKVSEANDSLSKPEVKKKIYSLNDNVKPQPDYKVGSDGGDPADFAKQERLRKVREKQVHEIDVVSVLTVKSQAKFKQEIAIKQRKKEEEETVPAGKYRR